VGPGRVTITGTGPGRIRVTDFAPALTIPARGSIVEVKDVQRIYSTKQLRNLEKGARARNVRLVWRFQVVSASPVRQWCSTN
jgi:hypothetical protein